VWADRDAGAARETAARLALLLAHGRERGADVPLPSAVATIARAAAQGRTLVLDPGDDPGSGGLGDTPELLRAMLACDIAASAIGVLADRGAVDAAHAAGVGADLVHPLGACFTPIYGPPVTAGLRVVRLLDDMVVLQAGQISLLVSERPRPAEPALFEAAGIDLGRLRLLAVKGGETTRAAFAHAFPLALAAGCAGPTSHDLSGLPFAYVPAARRAPDAAERYASAQQQRAGEPQRRDEQRRPHAQQQRPQSLGVQGPQFRVQA
jgi:microcystin degradation protein MlrC